MAQNVGRLGVVLGLDTAEFVQGLDKAKSKLTDFANNALPKIATAGAVAFSAMTYKALAFADAISDVAKANEIATSTILQLSEALAQNGGEAQNAGKLLTSFTAKIDEASQGSKTAQYAFNRIGVTLQDIKKLDNEELFNKTLQSLAKIDDPVQRNALAFQVFGRAVKGVDIKGLSEEMAHTREEFVKYANAVEIAGDLHDKLDAKATKTMVLFTNSFVPTLNTVFDSMNKTGSAFESFMEFGGEALKGLVYGVRILVTAFQTLNASVNLVGLTLEDMASGKFTTFMDRLKEYDAYVGKLRKEDKEFARKLLEKPEAPKREKYKGGREGIDNDQTAVKNAQLISYEYAMQSKLKFEQLQRQAELVQLTTNEKQVAEAVYRIQDEGATKTLELEKKIAEERAKQGANRNDALIAELEMQKKYIGLITDAYAEATKQEILAQQEAQRTFEFGWNKAFRQFAEDAGNYAKVAGDMFNAITNNMNSAIDNFVKSGKASFKDFTKSVIQDLIAIQLKAQAMSLFKGLGGLFGNIMTANQFGTNVGSQQTAMLQAQMSGFADGGDPPVGVPSIVGERGAELFVPKQAGTIIPNHQLSSVLGGGQTINYNGTYVANMQAIDTQSATQFLAKNKEAVWSANQSASRGLPTSR